MTRWIYGMLLFLLLGAGCDGGSSQELLNVSYDPTRELWRDLNERFIASFTEATGKPLVIKQSHAGSSTQARAVIDGLAADVVTLAMHSDIEAISRRGLIAPDWQERLPHHSLPYYSTIVFVVRKGNPKGIQDWPDLVKPDIAIVTPNPRTSGNGQLSLYAAWGSVTLRGGSEQAATDFVTRLYRQVPVLDSGARGSTTTFVKRKIGDVHLSWENEAHMEVKEAQGQLEIVYPPISIKAEPYVAVVDKNVDRKGTRAAAEAYLKFVYTDAGQEIVARHYYRPSSTTALARHAATFQAIKLFAITDIAKSWSDAHARFIGDGGVFDSIYRPQGK